MRHPTKLLIITCKVAQPRTARDVITHMWSRTLYIGSDSLALDIYFLKHQKQQNDFLNLLLDAPFCILKKNVLTPLVEILLLVHSKHLLGNSEKCFI